jgi:replicative DNA helicase
MAENSSGGGSGTEIPGDDAGDAGGTNEVTPGSSEDAGVPQEFPPGYEDQIVVPEYAVDAEAGVETDAADLAEAAAARDNENVRPGESRSAAYNTRVRPGSPKAPPHSVDAEQSVLGGLMLSKDAWFDVADLLEPRDFYRAPHQIIFEAMLDLSERDEPLDPLTVVERLQSKGLLEKAGGYAYVGELAESTPGISNIGAYARIVHENSTLRQLIGAANRIAESAFNPDGRPSDQLLDSAEQEVFSIAEGRLKGGGPESVKPLLTRTVDRIEKLFKSRDPVTGLATGFDDLDRKTAGLQDSDLVIVAGRPSMGKSALAMNLVEHALMESNTPVLVFSMEMPAEALVLRMLSSLGRIDQTRLRTGELQPEDWNRFTSAVSQLKDKPLYIDDTPALTPNDLRTRARRVAREAGGQLGLIVVDYLQLMRGSGNVENRTNEISEISRSLKALAKEMRCPMVALSQLNRALENRTDKRPMMADLRESGAIEQDADVILFIYRDEVYNPESEAKGTAEIIISKQRNGPIGMLRLSFIGNLTKFENLAPERYNDFGPTEFG